jgi:hypothetical protein
MIGQLSSRPELGAIFDDLFDPYGAYLAVEPASSYLPAGSHRFADVVGAARARGEIAIGYRHPDGRVRLNPPKSEAGACSRDGHVVVLKTRAVAPPGSGPEPRARVSAGGAPENGGASWIGRLRAAIGARLP